MKHQWIMREQLSKGCFAPSEFVVAKIEESFLRIRKLGICLITYLILFLLVLLSLVLASINAKYVPLFPASWFAFLTFSAIPIAFLTFIALRFADIDWVLSRHDCGDISDFEPYPKSLRNLVIICIIFWIFLPILGIIIGFILRKRMKDMRNMWVARFTPEPMIESEESVEV